MQAADMRDPETRRQMIAIADGYDHLAKRAELRAASEASPIENNQRRGQ
jgi:hypothetical protein